MGRGHEDSDLDEVMRLYAQEAALHACLAAADMLAVDPRCLGGSRQALAPRLGTAASDVLRPAEAETCVAEAMWFPACALCTDPVRPSTHWSRRFPAGWRSLHAGTGSTLG
jgi:hypothetical protein